MRSKERFTEEVPEDGEPQTAPQIKPGSLRRIKVFANLADDQLEGFLKFMEVIKVPPFKQVIHRGESGEAM